jgi:glucose/arabinose dehydrogenase
MHRPSVRHPWRVLAVILAGFLAGSVLITPAAWSVVRARRVVPCRAAVSLCLPTAFAFGPRGEQLFYTEKDTGQVRVRILRTAKDTVWTIIPNVATEGSQGLLGLALDPSWRQGPEHRWVYAYYTDEGVEDPNTPGEDAPDRNVIVRMRKSGSGLVTETLLVIPDAEVPHNGGVLRFGPDRKLYAVVGDGTVEARAQDPADPAGKMLRINKDGSIPASNPFPGSPVFSFGHRNSFGFTFDPRTGHLWQTENGPECNDEVNLVVEGGNYAWGPNQDCGSLEPPLDTNQDGPSPRRLPEWLYRNTLALTGATFCDQCGLGRNGDLLVGAHGGGGTIRALNLTRGRRGVTGQQIVFDPLRGVLAMETGPGHRAFFSDETGIWVLVRRNP